MKVEYTYRFWVGLITIGAGLLSLICLYVGMMAVEFNMDAFSDPTLTLTYSHNYKIAKWFNLLDLFGYYFLLIPIIFYFHTRYKFNSPWNSVFTFSGASYVLIGAIGASILAVVWPYLMHENLLAGQTQKSLIISQFNLITILVTQGLWNILEVLFASVWWLGLAKAILLDNKPIGILTLLLGICCLLDAIGNILDIKIMSEIGMNGYLFLAIIWAITVGLWVALPKRQIG